MYFIHHGLLSYKMEKKNKDEMFENIVQYWNYLLFSQSISHHHLYITEKLCTVEYSDFFFCKSNTCRYTKKILFVNYFPLLKQSEKKKLADAWNVLFWTSVSIIVFNFSLTFAIKLASLSSLSVSMVRWHRL